MKPYLSAFLLFFLLVDQSISPVAGIPLGPFIKGATTVSNRLKGSRSIWKKIAKKVAKELWENQNYFYPPPANAPPANAPPANAPPANAPPANAPPANAPSENAPPANAPPPQIEGLSLIKNYLYNYGYLNQSSGASFDDSFDEETILAIQTYQQYFNLEVTGDLNNQTLQQISLTRCYLPDINFDSGFDGNVSLPKAGHRWFPKGRNLTYGFFPASEIPENMTKVFRDAFTRWANASEVLYLTETASYDNADIKVGFYNLTDFEDEGYGFSLVVKQPSSDVKVGEIFLDGNKFWALPIENHSLSWEDEVLDLESVALHQIGHLLGLDHSNKNESVMYPYILPSQQRKVQLSDSDKVNIQRENINANSAEIGRWGGVPLSTTLSVGFAYVLLFY